MRVGIDDRSAFPSSQYERLIEGASWTRVSLSATGQNLKSINSKQLDLLVLELGHQEPSIFDLIANIREDFVIGDLPIFLLVPAANASDIQSYLIFALVDYVTLPASKRLMKERLRNLVHARRRTTSYQWYDEFTTGTSGRLRDVNLIDLVQTIESGNKTGHLSILDGKRKGVVYFHDGRIISAKTTYHSGEHAFYRLLTWKEGRFFLRIHPHKHKRLIQINNQALIVEGLRRVDEWERWLSKLPPLDSIVQTTPKILNHELSWVKTLLVGDITGNKTLQEVLDNYQGDELVAMRNLVELIEAGMLLWESTEDLDGSSIFEINVDNKNRNFILQNFFSPFTPANRRILLIGLSNSGKTTFMRQMTNQMESIRSHPTQTQSFPVDLGKCALSLSPKATLTMLRYSVEPGVSMEDSILDLTQEITDDLLGTIVFVNAEELVNIGFDSYLLAALTSRFDMPFIVSLSCSKMPSDEEVQEILSKLKLPESVPTEIFIRSQASSGGRVLSRFFQTLLNR